MNNMKLVIDTSTKEYEPAVLDGVELTRERTGAPAKLVFTMIKDDNISFPEGSRVRFWYKDKPVFCGYVFTKKRDRDHHIEITAYDQLRYFKNKFTYVFSKKKASDIIKLMCKDFGLKVGVLDDTGYTIPSLVEDGQTLFDIALDALDETIVNSGKMYVLYDDFGSIQLRELSNMHSTTLIDDETAANFDYTSSIDKDTYNKIILYYVDENTNKRIPYTAKDDGNIDLWGLLQYYEEVKTKSIGQNKANALLSLYNKKTRELTIKDAFGSVDIRGGSLIPVKLYLGDISVNNYMLVEKVTHKFKNDYYTMDITVNGNWGD